MSILHLIKNRASVAQMKMLPCVNMDEIKMAFEGITATPVHGKIIPYKFVVFGGDSLNAGRKALYAVKADKYDAYECFMEKFGGVGVFIFVFCKKIESKIPDYEQEWSTALATYSVQLSLEELGYVTKWNSIYKDAKYVNNLLDKCGLDNTYTTMGYVMVGGGDKTPKERASYTDFVDFK